MDKEQFKKEIGGIDVPQQEILVAIDKGISRGRKEKTPNRKINAKAIGAVSSIAASAFLASGLIFAPVSNVLAAVPLIGPFYEEYGLQIGYELSKSELVKETNQASTSNGVDITVTSAYYEGNVIGLTFNAQGSRLSMDREGDAGPEAGYNFYLFDGKEQRQWPSAMTQLETTADGFTAAIEFYNPAADLPADYKLPLTFTSMGGVKGHWEFNVPVKQISFETVKSEAETKLKGQDYAIKMESVAKGKATTILNYQTTLPVGGEEDEIRINLMDDLGNRLPKNRASILSNERGNELIKKDIRELFPSKLDEKASYLMVHPEIIRHEEDAIHSLSQSAPFAIESKRFEYSVDVNRIEQDGNQLIIDYTIQGIEAEAIREDLFQNFADFIMLVKTEDIQKDQHGERDIGKMMEHRVPSKPAQRLDEDTLHYQTLFTLEDASEFNINDYSLTVPFGTLSGNQPIKMEPIKVELTGN